MAFALFPGCFLASAQAKEKPIIDFSEYHRDPDGTTTKPYDYAWGDWSNHVQNYRDKGTLIVAAGGAGGLGDNNTPADFEGAATMELTYVIGNGNRAPAASFYLEDSDGTKQAWVISLAGKPTGRELVERLAMAKPSQVEAPGSVPGINPKQVKVWQFRGDNSAVRIEVLLVRLTRVK